MPTVGILHFEGFQRQLQHRQAIRRGSRYQETCKLSSTEGVLWNAVLDPGIASYQMERTQMRCVNFPIWIGIVTGTPVLSFLIAAIGINRKWEAVKLFSWVI